MTGCRPKEPVKAENLGWYKAPVCHVLRQSAKVLKCPGMCVALSMTLLIVTLFGKSRLNENSVEGFLHCNAFSVHCKCVEEHFQCILKHCQCVSTETKCVANPFKRHFQNVVDVFANTDNAFNETAAGCLESFTEPLLLDTMKSLV